MVPVGEAWSVGDLAVMLRLPILVVARAGLGTVNHTALTVFAAQSLGLEVVGVVLNGPRDESSATNPRLIEQLAGVPVLGQTPWLEGELTSELLRELVEEHVDIDTIVQLTIGAARA